MSTYLKVARDYQSERTDFSRHLGLLVRCHDARQKQTCPGHWRVYLNHELHHHLKQDRRYHKSNENTYGILQWVYTGEPWLESNGWFL